jgi:uncharacterized glyoxalase superfamily protein PhnB
MEITGLVLWTLDNTLSVKFYKKLGFDVVETSDRHSVVQLGTYKIFLVSSRDEDEFGSDSLASSKGKGMYIYVHSTSVDALYDRFIENGIIPHTKPRDWDWGNREFIVKDPDGYKLCFWTKSS